ncbi:putative metallophosphoesterase At3g03305 [Elaeis guineensis]|uniref:Metallophosphoesterase At3g03305 n=1 Tax=Elaeis guineensis var. tenera TaxID=51953 RepID=A0A6I9QWS8_ELAGV|nr:putative metallophosphoesterase At3g03305 [Elaeis guineensis]
MASESLICFLSPLFLLFSALSSSMEIHNEAGGDRDYVTRESFPMDGDVAWVVQVSDLHLSAFHPERAEDLVSRLASALRVIRPSLLLITGDITDAKNKRRTSTRQDETEWIQYRDTMDAIVRLSGIDRRTIFDIRGNHDKYGVPYVGHKLDFFSTYSVSSQQNRLSTIQSISLLGRERKYIFLGIDDTIGTGIRGPSNLFGHPTDKRMDILESELQYSDNYSGSLVTKIVFGHFPMSFTASSERGKRYESIFANHSVSAYICGHLHAKFGKQLWRLHTVELTSNVKEPEIVKQFWEWEVGDWKDSRLIRILAIDAGEVSFLDLEFLDKHKLLEDFETTILITYPTDSRNMNRIKTDSQSFRNDINALIFSPQPIINVTARVFDSFRDFKMVEEIPLQVATNSGTQKPLFHAKWNADNYRSVSATRYWLQVFVIDSQGKEIASQPRPFSVEGKLGHYQNTWLTHLIFEVQWENLYLILLWSNVGFLILFLFLPKVLNYFMEKNASYQKWVMSVSVSSHIQQRKSFFWVLWFLTEGSRSGMLWFTMMIYFFYLLKLPWFWGHATSEDGDVAGMYLSGWRIQVPNSSMMIDNLGIPDIFTIALPFMYLVVTPMIILIYCLFAERSAVCLCSIGNIRCSNGPLLMESEQGSQDVSEVPTNSSEDINHPSVYKTCGGWTRWVILLACLVIIVIHFKLCCSLMLAYGGGPVALSPALMWAPPLFLAAAFYSTRTIVNH